MKKIYVFTLTLIIGVNSYSQIITTYAGGGVGDGLLATSALLNTVGGTAMDASGNLYIADSYNHRIRKINTSGVISTIAGTGNPGYSGDGGPAVSARLNFPRSLAIDGSGNIYFADRDNNRIRKIDTSGTISTIAGTGAATFGGDGGPATSATLNHPSSICFDGSSNIIIADNYNNRVRKISISGVISTIAGNASIGYFGDGGPAVNATLYNPLAVAVNSLGELFIGDGVKVRKIDISGIISTVAGSGAIGSAGDGGPAINAQLTTVYGVFVDASNNLFIADFFNSKIRMVNSSGIISSVVSGLNNPTYVFKDGSGNLIISDAYQVKKLNTSNVVSVIAGSGFGIFSGDNGPATDASLYGPENTAFDSFGNLYIGDRYNGRIRKVSTTGVITTLTTGGSALAIDNNNNIYLAEDTKVRKIDPLGNITTIAGDGISGFSGDNGPAINARLSSANDIAVDANGNIYISGYSRIRKISSSGIITTIAGNGVWNYCSSGVQATVAEIRLPSGLALDSQGNLYFTDRGCHCVNKINTSGFLTRVAGGFIGYGGDNGPALSASLNSPEGIAVDNLGNIYVADTGNGRIRKIDTSGVISTFAGNGGSGLFAGDLGPATSAYLNYPLGVTVSNAGGIYIADTQNNRIRKVQSTQAITFNSLSPRCGNSAFTLSATSSSGLPITYSSSNSSLASISGNMVTLSSVAAQTSVVITASQAGNANYTAATSVQQTLTIYQDLTFSSQPNTASQSFCQNASTSPLTVAVSGPSLTYQWYSNTNSSNSGGTLIAGATGTSYSPPSNLVGVSYYYCAISSSCGVFNSNPSGAITILPPTVLSTHPSTSPQTVCQNGVFSTISVSATGGGTLTYQWYRNTTNSNAGGTLISGATSSTYTPSSASSGILYYYCTITGSCGVVISNPSGAMTVNSSTTINSQPSTSALSVCQNASAATLAVGASGTALSYQWYSNTTGSNVGGTIISGATNSTYTPPSNTIGTKYYYCTVTGTCGTLVSSVSGSVTTNTNPLVSASSSFSTICSGTSATMTASGASTYSWSPATDLSSTSGSSVVATPSISRTYTVTGTDSNGCVGTNNISLTVTPSPTPTITGTQNGYAGTANVYSTESGKSGYVWTVNPGANIVSGQGTANVAISWITTGAQTITVSYTSNGCSGSTSLPVSISTCPQGTITATPGTNICLYAYIDLAAGTGSNYLWNTGEVTQYIRIFDEGIYSVSYNVGACSVYKSINITASGPFCNAFRIDNDEERSTPIQSSNPDNEPTVTFLTLSPNPASESVLVQVPQALEESTPIYLYSMQGKTIEAGRINKGDWKATISIAEFAEGLYIVKVGSGGSLNSSKLLIKR